MHTADSSPNEIAISKAHSAAALANMAAECVRELEYEQAIHLLHKAGGKLDTALDHLPESRPPRPRLLRWLLGGEVNA